MRFRLGVTSGSCLALTLSLLSAATLSLLPAAAADDTFEAPAVDYSADMVREGSGAARAAGIFRTHDTSRTEVLATGRSMISIVDRVKKEAVALDPEKHTYSKIDLSEAGGGEESLSTSAYARILQGEETVGGIQTSRYLYEGTSNGVMIKGTVWITNDNIPMRNVATVSSAGHTTSVASHLENPKVEKQNPGLFEVPAGYTVQPMFSPAGKP